MQKHINIVDLVKSFPTNILLQNLASIQPRTSTLKFARSPCTMVANSAGRGVAAAAPRARRVRPLVERIDIELFSNFSAK